jgi:nitrogen regulatory protein PII
MLDLVGSLVNIVKAAMQSCNTNFRHTTCNRGRGTQIDHLVRNRRHKLAKRVVDVVVVVVVVDPQNKLLLFFKVLVMIVVDLLRDRIRSLLK